MTGRRSLLPVPERIGVTFSQWPTPVRGGGARYRSFGSFLSRVSRERVFRLLRTSRGSSSSGMTDIRNTWLVERSLSARLLCPCRASPRRPYSLGEFSFLVDRRPRRDHRIARRDLSDFSFNFIGLCRSSLSHLSFFPWRTEVLRNCSTVNL